MRINEQRSLMRINCATTGLRRERECFAIIGFARTQEVRVDYVELLDWRRRIATLFAELRLKPPTSQTAQWFREQKDGLFKEHSQSPILPDERSGFTGLPYWPYNPDVRVE